MTGITWLHLSDWHQGRPAEAGFDRDRVFQKLIEDIKSRTSIDKRLETIDFIVFSGDVAFSGKQKDYEQAKKFFDQVLKAVGLEGGKDRLFIVPGNHDLDEDRLDKLSEEFQQPLGSNTDSYSKWIDKFLRDTRNRQLLLNPFSDYKEFIKNYTNQDQPEYSTFKRLLLPSTVNIDFLGLNSALMARRFKKEEKVNDKGDKKVQKIVLPDRGNLIIGYQQVQEQLNQLDESHIKIAVLHHPLDWLCESDQQDIKNTLTANFDFILYGHRHRYQASQVVDRSGNCTLIATGATYDSLEYPNAYNFVHFDPETRRGKVYLRRWDNDVKQWVKAPFLSGRQVVYTGCYEFPPPQPINPLPKDVAPKIPPSLKPEHNLAMLEEDISKILKFGQTFALEGKTRLIYTCRSDLDKFQCPNTNSSPDPFLESKTTALFHIPIDELETYALCLLWYAPELLGKQEDDVKSAIFCSEYALKKLNIISQYFSRENVEIGANDEIDEILTDNLIIIGENDFSNQLFRLIKHQLPWRHNILHSKTYSSDDRSVTPSEILSTLSQERQDCRVKLYFNSHCTSSKGKISKQIVSDLTNDDYKWGIITFTQNPFAPEKRILFLVGCHRSGQYLLLSWLRRSQTLNTLSEIIKFQENGMNFDRSSFIQIIVKGEQVSPKAEMQQSIANPIRRHWSIETIENIYETPPHTFFVNSSSELNPGNLKHGDYISDLSLLVKIPDQASFVQSIKDSLSKYPLLTYLQKDNEGIGLHVTMYEFLYTIGEMDHAFVNRILENEHEFLEALKKEFEQLPSLHLLARQTRITNTSIQVLVDIYLDKESTEYFSYKQYLADKNRNFNWEYMNPNAMDLVAEICRYASSQIPPDQSRDHKFNLNRIPIPLHLTLLRLPQTPAQEILKQAEEWSNTYKRKIWGKLENVQIVLTGAFEYHFQKVKSVEVRAPASQ